ncbi:MAG: M28 family peptidase [Erythrobacter sp.]|nr:M28 family peptidase [Erythrobacter sp.]NCQ65189.1 M28 family peptidase [Alphaproteobacteria bacterium]
MVAGSIKSIFAGGALLLLAACAGVPATTPLPPPSLDAVEADLARDIAALADDSFGGRFPGTEGERKTRAWLIEKYAAIGLEPAVPSGPDGAREWTQSFTVVRRRPSEQPGASSARATRGGRSVDLSMGLIGVDGAQDAPGFADLPLVGLDPDVEDLRPRSLANRGLVLPASDLMRLGGQMTAAEPRAMIITSADQATFDGVASFLKRGRWQLDSDEGSPAILLLSPEASKKLTGLIGDTAKRKPDSAGVIAYDTILQGSIAQEVERIETANVVGRLPGKVEGSGAVLMLAHWDHLGDECRPPEAADRICNGAVDNASGLAVMTEAVRLAARQGQLDRDLIVLATSSEELGLLGAQAFVADPPVPLPTIAAAFNLDTMAIAPRGAPISVIGWGRTPLDPGIGIVADQLGRTLANADWQNAFLRRQDGWAFLSRDVPTVLVSSALADKDAFDRFMQGEYHGPADEFSTGIELGGAAEDTVLHAALLRYFGSLSKYPGARMK